VLVVNDDMDELSNPPCALSVDAPAACRSPPHSPKQPPASRTPSPSLPAIPAADLDLDLNLTLSFDSILGKHASAEPHVERVQKRASSVLKLTQENEKLKEELKAMTARIEAAERRRQEIATRQLQQTQQQPSSFAQPARSQGSS
jgi:hypothetical protein